MVGARSWAGCSIVEDSADLRVYPRTHRGPAWEGRPGRCAQPPRWWWWSRVREWSSDGHSLLSTGCCLLSSRFPWVCLCRWASTSSSVGRQHSGAPRDLLERVSWGCDRQGSGICMGLDTSKGSVDRDSSYHFKASTQVWNRTMTTGTLGSRGAAAHG